MTDLAEKQSQALDKGTPPLSQQDAENFLKELGTDWSVSDDGKQITRQFKFKNYYETMAFVNAVAMVAHQQDHHPDMTVSYNKCVVTFSTHSVGGLSENDFICAAKVDKTLHL